MYNLKTLSYGGSNQPKELGIDQNPNGSLHKHSRVQRTIQRSTQ